MQDKLSDQINIAIAHRLSARLNLLRKATADNLKVWSKGKKTARIVFHILNFKHLDAKIMLSKIKDQSAIFKWKYKTVIPESADLIYKIIYTESSTMNLNSGVEFYLNKLHLKVSENL